MENQELTHWGIKGMRWGVRRYQNKDGSLTAAGKKRYGDSEMSPEEAKKIYEEGKQKALKSGTASEVLKYKGDLTPNEMASAISRIRWEQDMKTISDKEVVSGKAKADKIFGTVDTITGYTNTAIKAYNTVANIYNAFSGTSSISLPKIDTNNSVGNKAVRKKEKKDRDDAQKLVDEAAKKAKEEAATKQKEQTLKDAQRQVDDYNRKEAENATRSSSQYAMKGKSAVDDLFKSTAKVSSNDGDILELGHTHIAGLLEAPKDVN